MYREVVVSRTIDRVEIACYAPSGRLVGYRTVRLCIIGAAFPR